MTKSEYAKMIAASEMRHKDFMERLEENGKMIRELTEQTRRYAEDVCGKELHHIWREGKVIHFVPSYAVNQYK